MASKVWRGIRERIGADAFRIMPARRLFALGVGHVRRKTIEPGAKSDTLGEVLDTNVVKLSALDWRVLEPLKREFAVDEIRDNPWASRAEEAGVPLDQFIDVARSLNERKVIGRFSTFLEHVKPSTGGTKPSRCFGLAPAAMVAMVRPWKAP